MDLEQLNYEYRKLKEYDLVQTKLNIEVYEEDLQKLQDMQLIESGNQAYFRLTLREEEKNAREEGREINKELVSDFEKAYKESKENEGKIMQEYERLRVEAENEKEMLKKIQEMIEEKIEQLKQEPGMKEHIDAVLAEKYRRQIKALNLEKADAVKDREANKAELVEKRDNIYEFQELLAKHPSIANNLRGIIEATIFLSGIGNDYKTENLEEGMKKIQEAKEKGRKNKELLEHVLRKSESKLTVQDMMDSLGNTIIRNGDNNLEIYIMINRNLQAVEREISQLDGRVENIDKAIQKNTEILKKVEKEIGILNDKVIKKQNQPHQKEKNPLKQEPKNNTPVKVVKKEIHEKKKIGIIEQFKKDLKENDLNWWNFSKIFSLWNRRRKLPKFNMTEAIKNDKDNKTTFQEPEAQKTPETKTEQGKKIDDKFLKNTKGKNVFRNSLKYEIVQDILKEEEARLVSVDRQEPKEGDR